MPMMRDFCLSVFKSGLNTCNVETAVRHPSQKKSCTNFFFFRFDLYDTKEVQCKLREMTKLVGF